jgi:hypothetical protein
MLYAVSALVLLGFIVLFAVVTPKLKQNNKKKEEKALYKKYLSQFDPNKSKTKLDPIFTKIAGTRYKNDDTGASRQELLAKAKVGEFLLLMPEPTNKHDADAIRIFRANGDQLGFLDTDLAMEINSRLQKRIKVTAKITAISGTFPDKEVHIQLQRYSKK